MATFDLRRGNGFVRSANASTIATSPSLFDTLSNVTGSEDDTYLGYWSEIHVIGNPDFPDDATHVFLEDGGAKVGRNLSSYNAITGVILPISGYFSEIIIPAGSLMNITAYRF